MAKRGNNEGSIYRRKDRRWGASLTLPNGKRKHFYSRTRADAAERLRQAQHLAGQGLPIPPQRVAFGSFAEKWLEEIARPRLRPRTTHGYRSILYHDLLPEFSRTRLAELTPARIQAYMNAKLEVGLSPQTVKNHHALLRRILGDAHRYGLVGQNTAKLVSPPRVVREPIRPLSVPEARSLLEALRGDRLEALVHLAIMTGMRSGELLGLTWDMLDLERGELRVERALQRLDGEYRLVETKTHRSRRRLPLPQETAALLSARRAAQAEDRRCAGPRWLDQWGLVFTNEQGWPTDAKAVRRRLDTALARAGLPHIRVHDLRHTAASLMLAAGTPLKVVQEVLGHSTIAVTSEVYAHLAPELAREATDSVARLLSAAPAAR